jgi:hypothetical protein
MRISACPQHAKQGHVGIASGTSASGDGEPACAWRQRHTPPRGGPVRSSKFVPVRLKPAIATASITLDTDGHLFPDELEAPAGRLEDARADALATLARTQRGPAVVPIREGAGQ